MENQLHILVIAASSARRLWISDLLYKKFKRETIEVVTAANFSRGLLRSAFRDILVADLETPAAAAGMIRHMTDSPEAFGSVALIDDPNPRWVKEALRAGVHAIISRDPSSEEFHLAIGAAEAGLVLLHPSSARNLIADNMTSFSNADSRAELDLEPLTPREHQVLGLMSEGLGNKEIAARLQISEHTAKFHISSILGKLSAASRTEAVSQGIKRGLISI